MGLCESTEHPTAEFIDLTADCWAGPKLPVVELSSPVVVQSVSWPTAKANLFCRMAKVQSGSTIQSVLSLEGRSNQK
jgi:hypothetical protein